MVVKVLAGLVPMLRVGVRAQTIALNGTVADGSGKGIVGAVVSLQTK